MLHISNPFFFFVLTSEYVFVREKDYIIDQRHTSKCLRVDAKNKRVQVKRVALTYVSKGRLDDAGRCMHAHTTQAQSYILTRTQSSFNTSIHPSNPFMLLSIHPLRNPATLVLLSTFQLSRPTFTANASLQQPTVLRMGIMACDTV